MMVFKQIVLNGLVLRECQFERESELQGYLIAHPEMLSLVEGNEDYQFKDLIGVERTFKGGRVDMVASYEAGQIAIIELKRGKIIENDYTQLRRYLKNLSDLEKWNVVESNKKLIEGSIRNGNVFGVLVGSSISEEVKTKLKSEARVRPVINGLTIKRYKAGDNEYLMTEVISNFGAKDRRKYTVNGCGPFGKGRTVLASIRAYVSKHRVNFSKLSEEIFPSTLRGTNKKWGCISLLRDARELESETGRARHFLNAEDLIVLRDGSMIAVSSQWGIDNIWRFIRRARELGIQIEEVRGAR